MTKQVHVPVNKILLDENNIRTGEQQNQKDAFRAMLDEQGKDLVELAEDICKEGLAPYRLPIVIPAEEKGYYTVLDGNRRVSAIKLVKNPALAEGTPLARRFRDLNSEYEKKIPTSVECIQFPDRHSADRWIRVEHYKGQSGVGLQEWSALARARADRIAGKPVLALDALEFACSNHLLNSEAREIVSHPKRFNFTNLERLIETPKVREVLGLEIDNRTKKLKAHSNPKWLLKVLTRIVEIIATEEVVNEKKFSVDHIRTVEQQEKFVRSVTDEVGKRPRKIKPWRVTEEVGAETDVDDDVPQSKRAKLPKRPTPSNERISVVPRSFSIKKIQPAKLNDIFIELCNLKVQQFPHSSAFLLRTFIELSILRYVSKHSITLTKKQSMSGKVQKVLDDLVRKDKIDEDVSRAVKSQLDKSPLGLTCELNQYVHSLFFKADYKAVNTAWDNIEVIIPHLFD